MGQEDWENWAKACCPCLEVPVPGPIKVPTRTACSYVQYAGKRKVHARGSHPGRFTGRWMGKAPEEADEPQKVLSFEFWAGTWSKDTPSTRWPRFSAEISNTLHLFGPPSVPVPARVTGRSELIPF